MGGGEGEKLNNFWEQYYKSSLKDIKEDPNIWKDKTCLGEKKLWRTFWK